MSNESDTPRTDAQPQTWVVDTLFTSYWAVPRKHARALERELAAAQARIAELETEQLTVITNLVRQRDEMHQILTRNGWIHTPGAQCPWKPPVNIQAAKANQRWAKAEARIAELESSLEAERRRTAEELNCQQRMHAMELNRLAQQPPAPQFLERPDKPGWWWHKWEQNGSDKVAISLVWTVEDGQRAIETTEDGVTIEFAPTGFTHSGIWLRATPPKWTPSEEGAK